jgi:hypothetical protein
MNNTRSEMEPAENTERLAIEREQEAIMVDQMQRFRSLNREALVAQTRATIRQAGVPHLAGSDSDPSCKARVHYSKTVCKTVVYYREA